MLHPAHQTRPLLAWLLAGLLLGLPALLAGCATTPPPPTPPTSPTPPEPGLEAPAEAVALRDGRATFEIANPGSRALAWRIEIRNDPANPQPGAWFDVAPESAVTPAGGRTPVTLTLRPELAAGRYRATLTIRYEGGQASLAVEADVAGSPPAPPPPDPPPPDPPPEPTPEPPPQPQPGFSLRLEPRTLELEQGQSGQVTVTVEFDPDFTAGVELDVSGAPSSMGTSLAAAGGTRATLTVRAGATAPGSYSLQVTGRGGGLERSAELLVQVLAQAPATASVSGRVSTANAEIPVTPPAVGAGVSSLAQTAGAADGLPYVPGQLLVRYAGDAAPLATHDAATTAAALAAAQAARRAVATAVAADYGLEVLREGAPGQVDVLELPAGQDPRNAAQALAADPRIAYAEPNYRYFAQQLGSLQLTDPRRNELWQLPAAGVPLGWQADDRSVVVVAVIDTSIDLDHPDLAGVFVSGGFDFCAAGDCLARDGNPRPDNVADRHGTHVTGILAAVGNNGRGVAGVLAGGARVLPVKVFHQGVATAEAIAAAIRWAAGESVDGLVNPTPARILNLSLGGANPSRVLEEAILAAQQRGVLVVAAAGNQGGALLYPARYDGVLAVGAVNSRLQRACFSSFGVGLDLMAPGGDGVACAAPRNEGVLSTVPGGSYGVDLGTSMAAPVVAGVAALLWEAMPGADATALTAALKAAAYFDGRTMTANEYGAGVVRLDRALGFPGPGSSVSVTATASSGNGSGVATATLDPFGGSSPFTMTDLPPGSYRLEATATGSPRDLRAAITVELRAGEQTGPLTVPLAP